MFETMYTNRTLDCAAQHAADHEHLEKPPAQERLA
jgi:hypothetical protein